MPSRSKITQLPPEIKAKLDHLLMERGFSGYEGMAEEINTLLADAEYEIKISRSGLHRYGQGFEAKMNAIKLATEQARAIADAAGDDEGAMNDALIRLIQQKSFDFLVKLQDESDVSLPKMGTMIARISHASVQQKKWQAEAREKAKEAADDVVKLVKKGGLSNEKAEEIRNKILGIV